MLIAQSTLVEAIPYQVNGEMYAFTMVDALAKTKVIAGILPVRSKPPLVLFDF